MSDVENVQGRSINPVAEEYREKVTRPIRVMVPVPVTLEEEPQMSDNDSFIRLIQDNPTDNGLRLVYADWFDGLHPSGGPCVLGRWPDYRERDSGPRAWFVAPSFEAFLCRVWLENLAWEVGHADFLRRRGQPVPSVAGALQAYLEHYECSPSPVPQRPNAAPDSPADDETSF
jgi:hypothetical protein